MQNSRKKKRNYEGEIFIYCTNSFFFFYTMYNPAGKIKLLHFATPVTS